MAVNVCDPAGLTAAELDWCRANVSTAPAALNMLLAYEATLNDPANQDLQDKYDIALAALRIVHPREPSKINTLYALIDDESGDNEEIPGGLVNGVVHMMFGADMARIRSMLVNVRHYEDMFRNTLKLYQYMDVRQITLPEALAIPFDRETISHLVVVIGKAEHTDDDVMRAYAGSHGITPMLFSARDQIEAVLEHIEAVLEDDDTKLIVLSNRERRSTPW